MSETGGEGRLSRWSRLKRQGGNDTRPEAPAAAVEAAYAVPDPNTLPGGAAIRRRQAPTLPSLVGEDDGPAPAQPIPVDPDEARELTPEEAAVVAELPPIETLTKESDFTPFLADKVPDFIRRRALSVLWRSDPLFGHLDGLNDYDLNYRVIDTVIDIAKDTIYRVGKGHRTDEEEAADRAEEAAAQKAVEAKDADTAAVPESPPSSDAETADDAEPAPKTDDAV
jgi:hypothetical protein